MEFPAARKGDVVTHELVPQSGTILPPSGGPCANKRVIIENKDAAHVGCQTPCTGKCSNGFVVHPDMPPSPANIIMTGSTSVIIHHLAAARWAPSGDVGTCGCNLGEPLAAEGRTVFIGGPSGPTPAKEVPKACDYLKKNELVTAPPADFDRFRAPTKLGPGVAGKYTFKGSKYPSAAVVHEIEVKGRKIKLTVPAGNHSPTAEQVAKSLGTLPEHQLDSVKDVTVSPFPDPDDKDSAKLYKTPGFTAAGEGLPGGRVNIFPAAGKDQTEIDRLLLHESGHTFSAEYWKDPANKKAWEEAMASDGRSPSNYADTFSGEDFSESVVMYNLSRGTPCQIFANVLFPARYAILQKALGT